MSTHPYSPPSAQIANFIPKDYSALTLISIFAGVCLVQSCLTYLIVTHLRPQISTKDLNISLWFSICGTIHLVLEGFYALHPLTMPAETSLLAQLWKEYAYSDSRYLIPNSFIWPMEVVTAFIWGPVSFTMVYLIAREHPLRYPLQIIISVGQLYGDVLYYGTCLFEKAVFGVEYARPEAGYFWGYYVGLNLFWVVIPYGCIVNGVRACRRAFESEGLKKNA